MGQIGGCAIAKVSEVSNEVEMMKKLNEELYTALDALQNRLNGVLKNVPPSPSVAENTKDMTLVPLATTLREENRKISYAITTTNQIRDRIEL
jgi:hypothetical protein